jgi:type I restriction enzyme M protein
LQGGIPVRDLEAMQTYWNAYPKLKHDLFSPLREGYVKLNVAAADIKTTIFNHPEFKAFNETLNQTYNHWLSDQFEIWEKLQAHCNGRDLIAQMSESLLEAFENNTLVNGYDLYQHVMTYWQETMQDDVYSISLDGWKAGNEWERTIIKGKKGKDGKVGKDKEVSGLAGIEGRMISPDLLVNFYFNDLVQEIYTLKNEVENAQTLIAEIEEEQSGEEGLFSDLEKINAAEVLKLLKARQKEDLKMVAEPNSKYGTQIIKSDLEILEDYLFASNSIKDNNATVKILEAQLEEEVMAKYPELTEDDIKELVIQHKWMAHLTKTLHQEQDKISQGLTQRINALAERYATTLETSQTELAAAETKVMAHLEKMGLVW